MSDSMRAHRRQPTRLPCPWDSPGKNTGVGCHFLLQCMKVKNESEVTQSCPTLSNPMDCSPPGSSVHGIFWARVLEWGAIAFSNLHLQSHINEVYPQAKMYSCNSAESSSKLSTWRKTAQLIYHTLIHKSQFLMGLIFKSKKLIFKSFKKKIKQNGSMTSRLGLFFLKRT